MRTYPDPDPGIPDHRSPIAYLRWVVRRHWRSVYAAIGFAILWMLCQAFVPAIVGKAIDAATDGDRSGLLTWSLVLLAAGLGQAVFGICRHRFAVTNFIGGMFATVQVAVRHAGRLGSALSRRLGAGEVVAIGTSDIRQIGSAVDITARGTSSLLAVVVVSIILLTTSVPLGLVVVFGVPLLMGIVSLLIRPLHHRQQASREQQGRLTGRAADLVGGLRVLRGIGGEAVMGERYRAESQLLRAAGVRTARVEALLEAAQVLLPGIFLVLVTWLGARFALDGHITVGQLVSFYAYAAFLVTPLRQLTEAIDKLTRGHVSARRVVAMLRTTTDLPDPADPVAPERFAGELADPASGVTARPGEITAIVATVPAEAAAVADRLGRYAEGATVDGLPLDAFALATVRSRVLVADNDARLFTGPMRSDLDPGDSGRLPAALHTAAATDIVEALPDGLDSEVAERGRTFSGGQQQRLRLVRALVADPDALILVEPTSAVDAHTEARIADRLLTARAGRTTVIVTSSPLVLDRTDRVLFVERGRVVADGTHHELLTSSPGYARTVLREDES
ncbi:ABC transporter ATP-binding protein/permease [Actinoplanes bogorensis]|uniref:ABC transporter ATP-binding protein/permease n=1 Tax=Paractinoplanes bogorensis TaxID=1610840 RepID=A0ABS5Z022_9ACTN|nr:ABC transporter ATP-binding protein [Actinoplanes bogorensis]MBU2668706.1 ABC transporter ATP-binding protein/permease [Actinoplanes bogorensis]